jgi:HD domain
MTTDLGTLAWAQRTGGTTTAADEQTLAAQIAYVLEQRNATAPALTIDVDSLAAPDSALTRDAQQCWNDTAPAWLHGHGHRTWLYAAALAQIWNLQADRELLYSATLLHDLGLTDTHAPTDEHPCFAVSGAHGARPIVARHRPAADADNVYEAIAMHLNLRIDSDDPICQLVPAATLVDVTPAIITHVNTLHPRHDFGPRVGAALNRCATTYPQTRCGWLERTLNISTLSTKHPLEHR